MSIPSHDELMAMWIDHIDRNDKMVTFYYGVQDGLFHLLPIGAVFIGVYSPSPFMTFPAWALREFQVVETKSPTNGKFERYYRAIDGRELTADEIAYFEQVADGNQDAFKIAGQSNEDGARSDFDDEKVSMVLESKKQNGEAA